MDNVLLTLVPTAIGIAVSPAAIIELILVLFSARRLTNGIAFLATLLLSTIVLLTVGVLGGQAADSGTGTTSAVMGWVLLALGLLLLVLGVKNWRNRRDTSEPAVFATVTSLGPGAVAFLAFGAVFLNPKNTVLILTGGQAVGSASSPWLVGAAFVVVATLPYTLAVGYALLGGEAANARLDRMRAWLVAHNRLIMGIVCAVLGAVLTLKGIAAAF